jgi:hypothetical protein
VAKRLAIAMTRETPSHRQRRDGRVLFREADETTRIVARFRSGATKSLEFRPSANFSAIIKAHMEDELHG